MAALLFVALLGCAELAAATCTRESFVADVTAGNRAAADLVAECREYLLQSARRKETLAWIVRLGELDLVQALLDLGYAIESGDGLIFEALGAEKDPAEMVELLIAKGLSVDAANEASNVLFHAIELGHSRTLQVLVAHLGDKNALYAPDHLFAVILPDDLELAEEILARGADPNFVGDRHGTTPLMVAADRGSAAMIELLIARGADCWRRISVGSAFDFAATEEKRALLERACRGNARSGPRAIEAGP